jgi:CheY-like chemotaxis protein
VLAPPNESSAGDPATPAGGVLLAVRDLLFRVRLEAAARDLGSPVHRPGPRGLLETAAGTRPDVVVVDLADAGAGPLEAVRALRGDSRTAALPIVGFAPHTDAAMRAAAREAGCTVVVARSRMAAAAADVLAPFLERRNVPKT